METIPVVELFPGGKSPTQLSTTLTIDEVPTVGEITADFEFRTKPMGFNLSGKLTGTYLHECDQCLTSFEEPFDVTVDELFVYEHFATPDQDKDREKELRAEDYYETVDLKGDLDLAELVRQILIMENPGPVYCKEHRPLSTADAGEDGDLDLDFD